MENTMLTKIIKKILLLILILIPIFIVYEIGNTIYLKKNTGILIINSPGAFLTLEQGNFGLINIGKSYAKIRIKYGNYELIATKGQAQVTKSFYINKGQVVNENFKVNKPVSLSQSASTVEGNKLIKSLPFIGPNFNYEINYTYNITSSAALPIITITAINSTYQQDAINWINAIGINPKLLNIKYIYNQPTPLVNSQSGN